MTTFFGDSDAAFVRKYLGRFFGFGALERHEQATVRALEALPPLVVAEQLAPERFLAVRADDVVLLGAWHAIDGSSGAQPPGQRPAR
jgi:hypothetical protein